MKYEHGARLLTKFFEENADKTKQWLADECGVTRSTVHYWTVGHNRPGDDQLRLLVEVLTSVPSDAWFTDDELARRNIWTEKALILGNDSCAAS